MTANDPARILGIIFLIMGGLILLGIVGVLIFLVAMGGVAAFNASGSDSVPLAVMFLIFGIFTLLTVVFAIPQLIAGWNLLKGTGRGRIWVLVSAIINVLSFPIGTIIGIYAFWFMFGDEGKRYFRN